MSFVKNTVYNTFEILRKDEDLLRLLYYPPFSLRDGQPSPLDSSYDNILDFSKEKYWKVVDNHLLLTSKSSDLEEKELCRIYVYGGKIRSSLKNKFASKQELVLDVFVHHSFEQEQRLDVISDRISDILFYERVGGLGRVEYRNGYDFSAPKDYIAYRHIYEVGNVK